MRITFVLQPRDTIERGHGGSVTLVSYQLAKYLARTHRVKIYARHVGEQPLHELDDLGIEIRRIPGVSRRLNSALEIATGLMDTKIPWFASRRYYRRFIEKVAHEVRKEDVDIIHAGACTQLIMPLRRAAPKARIVFHVHDESITRINQRLIEKRLEGADLVLAVNDYLTGRLRERFPLMASRFRTLHNGVDVEQFRPGMASDYSPHSQRRLLYVGRLSPEKGVHILVEAFARVLESYPNCLLDLVGSSGFMPFAFIRALSSDPAVAGLIPFYGKRFSQQFIRQVLFADSSYVRALQRAVSSDVRKRITFHSAVRHPELLAFYRGADLLIGPSVCNEEPLSLAEAMACGLPTVCTYQSSSAELVLNEHTGLVVERANVARLTEAILALLSDARRSRRMGVAGRRRVERYFSWQRVAEELLDHYRELKGEVTSRISGS